jgi:putative tributyrin esterase
MRNDQSLRANPSVKVRTCPQKLGAPQRAGAYVRSRRARLRCSVIFAAACLLSCGSMFAQKRPAAPGIPPSSREEHAILQDASFRSESLGREMHYRVILPAGYNSSSVRYPALYLLHGLYGDYENWSTRTNLVRYADTMSVIIAMPDADNSWYANSAANPRDKFEDYVVKDFVVEVDSHYRTIRERYARAIAGLSMGGYGAVKFALKYPGLFAAAGGISATLNAPRDLDAKEPGFRDDLQKAFGPPGNPGRTENDVFELLGRTQGAQSPYIYLDCGADDMFLHTNREFAARLQERGIAYEYHEMPGAHTWDYWDGAILRFLKALDRRSFLRSRGERDPGGRKYLSVDRISPMRQRQCTHIFCR